MDLKGFMSIEWTLLTGAEASIGELIFGEAWLGEIGTLLGGVRRCKGIVQQKPNKMITPIMTTIQDRLLISSGCLGIQSRRDSA